MADAAIDAVAARPHRDDHEQAAHDAEVLEELDLLLSLGADPNKVCAKDSQYPLAWALSPDDPGFSMARRLLAAGADPRLGEANGKTIRQMIEADGTSKFNAHA